MGGVLVGRDSETLILERELPMALQDFRQGDQLQTFIRISLGVGWGGSGSRCTSP